MKHYLLLSVLLVKPAFAIVLPDDAPLLPQPTASQQNQQQDATTPTTSRPQASQGRTFQPAEALADDPNAEIPPEEMQELIQKFKNMSPEEMKEMSGVIKREMKQGQGADDGLVEETQYTVEPAMAGSPSGSESMPNQPSLEQLKRERAFNALVEEVLPLSPDQIKKLHRYYDMTLQAKATPPNPPPSPHFTSTIVNLEPGSVAPVIRLSAGFVSSLVFIDSTGAAWPITAYSIGDPQNFNVQWDQKGNTLFIQSLKEYNHGNLAVRLWGLNTPVMLTLVSGQRNVDFRVDLQVGGRGPDAKPMVIDRVHDAKVDQLLINLLDGIPPKGSIKLGVSGGHGEAWYSDNKIYFRSKLTLLSPAWTATVASPDGTHVYELMQTPRLLASQNGKTVDIKLAGF